LNAMTQEQIAQIQKENKQLQQKLYLQERLTRSLLIQQLIQGTHSLDARMTQMLSDVGVTFKANNFLIVLVRVMTLSPLFQSTGKDDSRYDEVRDIGAIILNIFGELIEQKYPCWGANCGDGIPFLVNLTALEEDNKEAAAVKAAGEITRLTQASVDVIHSEFGIGLQVVIGPPCFAPSQIWVSYLNTYSLSLYAMAMKPERTVYAYFERESWEKTLLETTVLNNKFVHAIMNRKLNEASDVLFDLIKSQLGATLYDYQSLRQFLISQFIAALSVVTPPILPADTGSFLVFIDTELKTYFNQVYDGCGSLAELKKLTADIFARLSHYLTGSNDTLESRVFSVMRYIMDHFSDDTLSASFLSNKFQMRLPQLSREFRQTTGVKLIDYIHKVRIKEANRLLSASGFNIETIGTDVGYVDAAAFIRTYKRYEGITPGQYRKSHLLEL